MAASVAEALGNAEPHARQAWRTAEIEEWTNRWIIHPASWWLAQRAARWGIHPNLLSLAGLGSGVAAALAYGFWQYGWTCWVGFACMLLWHVLDGADGQLARLTGKSSELGKLVDGVCDHGTFAALYLALGLSLHSSVGRWIWALVAGAALSHFVQAGAYERQRQLYEYFVHSKPVLAARWEQVPWVLRPVYRLYAAVQRWLSGEELLLRQVRSSSAECVARLYRQLLLPVVWGWSILSSNYRTAALFVCCLAGMPQLFLAGELVLLNAAMLLLWGWTRRRQRRFVEQLRLEAALVVG
jgi:phosphatidylglycerophosphate synthase